MVSPKRLAFEKAYDCFEFELFKGASVSVLLKAVPYVVFIISDFFGPVGAAGAAVVVTGAVKSLFISDALLALAMKIMKTILFYDKNRI